MIAVCLQNPCLFIGGNLITSWELEHISMVLSYKYLGYIVDGVPWADWHDGG